MDAFSKYKMQERTEPKFVNFGAGETVEGVLLAIVQQKIGGQPGVKYFVQEPDCNVPTTFNGLTKINEKLRHKDIGHYVVIRCTGENANVGQGSNKMKTFNIFVSEEVVDADAAKSVITDNDVPLSDVPFPTDADRR